MTRISQHLYNCCDTPSRAGLGARLRHLLDLLDGDVGRVYADAGLDYRPRFTPVVKALRDRGPCSLTDIAADAGLTHSAISQTVAEMRRRGLVRIAVGADARSKRVALTPKALRQLPQLETRWNATSAAAAALDRELHTSPLAAVDQAIAALERRSFYDRIDAQAAQAVPQLEKP